MLHTPRKLAVEHETELKHRAISDAEWTFLQPFVTENPRRPGRPPRDHRLVLDGIFWVACSGAPWRSLPQEYGNWGSVYRQFLRWTRSGLWQAVLEALENTDAEHHPGAVDHFAGVDRDYLTGVVNEARVVALRPRSTQGRSRPVGQRPPAELSGRQRRPRRDADSRCRCTTAHPPRVRATRPSRTSRTPRPTPTWRAAPVVRRQRRARRCAD